MALGMSRSTSIFQSAQLCKYHIVASGSALDPVLLLPVRQTRDNDAPFVASIYTVNHCRQGSLCTPEVKDAPMPSSSLIQHG